MHKVFVYGTLKAGFGNHRVLALAESALVGEFKTKPEFTMLSLGGFPGLIAEGTTAVSGELWEVEHIEGLDRLEGHPTFYKRTEIMLEGYDEPVETYILQTDNRDYGHCSVVSSGVWEGYSR